MLTANERKWLECRCNYCDWCSLELSTDACYRCIGNDECPIYPMGATAWSAAEFESRVAATLTNIYAELDFDYGCHDCPVWRPCNKLGQEECKFMILKYARLLVEEEMYADSK